MAAAVVRAAEVVVGLALHAAPEEGLARVARRPAKVVTFGALAANAAQTLRRLDGSGRRGCAICRQNGTIRHCRSSQGTAGYWGNVLLVCRQGTVSYWGNVLLVCRQGTVSYWGNVILVCRQESVVIDYSYWGNLLLIQTGDG